MDPLLIHVVTVPLTLVVGFFFGWVFRGAAAKRAPGAGAGFAPRPPSDPGRR